MTITDAPRTATRPAKPLRIGPIEVDAPVVLAPMAGIPNRPYRRLGRVYGAGLYVCEMITSRALVERTPVSISRLGTESAWQPSVSTRLRFSS